MNELEKRAKFNKKHSKGWGWFVKPNAGNVEYNNARFNSSVNMDAMPVGGPSSSGESSASCGMGESISEEVKGYDKYKISDIIDNDGIIVYNNNEYQMPDNFNTFIEDLTVETVVEKLDNLGKYTRKLGWDSYNGLKDTLARSVENDVFEYINNHYFKDDILVLKLGGGLEIDEMYISYLYDLVYDIACECIDAYNEEEPLL